MSTETYSPGDIYSPTTTPTLSSVSETNPEESWTIYHRVYELIVYQEMQKQIGVGPSRLVLLSESLTPEEYLEYKWQKEVALLREVVKKYAGLRVSKSSLPPGIKIGPGGIISGSPSYHHYVERYTEAASTPPLTYLHSYGEIAE